MKRHPFASNFEHQPPPRRTHRSDWPRVVAGATLLAAGCIPSSALAIRNANNLGPVEDAAQVGVATVLGGDLVEGCLGTVVGERWVLTIDGSAYNVPTACVGAEPSVRIGEQTFAVAEVVRGETHTRRGTMSVTPILLRIAEPMNDVTVRAVHPDALHDDPNGGFRALSCTGRSDGLLRSSAVNIGDHNASSGGATWYWGHFQQLIRRDYRGAILESPEDMGAPCWADGRLAGIVGVIQGSVSDELASVTFADWVEAVTSAPPTSVPHDVDGDGISDLIVEQRLNGQRAWFGLTSNGVAFEGGDPWSTSDDGSISTVGIADVDGDGRADLVVRTDDGPIRTWSVRLSDGARFVDAGAWATTDAPGIEAVGLVDADGDGRADLVLEGLDAAGVRHWTVRPSNGAAFAESDRWAEAAIPGIRRVGLADVDSDRRVDLVLQYEGATARTWQARLSDGERFVDSGDWTTTNTAGVEVVGVSDVDGDGQADLVLQFDASGTRRWQARRSTGAAFEYNGTWTSTGTRGVDAVGLADVNGDGMSDLVLTYVLSTGRRWQARLSTGAAFAYNGAWSTGPRGGIQAFDLADVDGDGMADLFLQHDDGPRAWSVRRSTGTAFVDSDPWAAAEGPASEPVGDAWRTPRIER